MEINVSFKTQTYKSQFFLSAFRNTNAPQYIKNCSTDTVCFSGHENKSVLKRIAPYIIVPTMICSVVSSCSDDRIFGTENFDDTKIEYSNVKQETKDSLIKPIIDLKSKLNDKNDFLKGVSINLTNTYSDMNNNHSFKKFLKELLDTEEVKGTSYYSDKKIPRIIIIQEGAHNFADKFLTYTKNGKFSNIPALKHSLMHEVGHQFDYYFGHNHDAQYAKDFDNMIYKKEKNPDTNPYSYDFENQNEIDTDVKYRWNNCLSDKKDFQKAILEDFKNIAKIQKNNPEKLPCNIEYYAEGIDFSKNISSKDVDLADNARTETYANLFAYAIGENDGDKDDFINAFKNSYKIVCRDITEKLGKNVLK